MQFADLIATVKLTLAIKEFVNDSVMVWTSGHQQQHAMCVFAFQMPRVLGPVDSWPFDAKQLAGLSSTATHTRDVQCVI